MFAISFWNDKCEKQFKRLYKKHNTGDTPILIAEDGSLSRYRPISIRFLSNDTGIEYEILNNIIKSINYLPTQRAYEKYLKWYKEFQEYSGLDDLYLL